MEPMYLPDVEANAPPSAYTKAIEIMREPAPLPAGLRELIAAYTSRRNHCPF